MSLPSHVDVVIVGAGPAGLSAALVLARCGRRILVCDRGTPRNWAAKRMHGFLTREGIAPQEFLRLAEEEVRAFDCVRYWRGEIKEARAEGDGTFRVRVGDDDVRARKLLIATGLEDRLPDVAGLRELFGSAVFNCPYCDGWEFRDQPLAAYGRRNRGFEMARALTVWSRDVVLCTDGGSGLSPGQRDALQRNGVRLVEERVASLEGSDGQLRAIVFRSGLRVPRAALFFDTPSRGQSSLAGQLGCRFNRNGGVLCGQHEATSVPGVFVAGNILRDVQLSIVAAAEGARAAFGINRALAREDFTRRATGHAAVEHPPVPAPQA